MAFSHPAHRYPAEGMRGIAHTVWLRIQWDMIKMIDSNFQTEQNMVIRQDKSKRKLWLWGCGGSIILFCVLLGVGAFYLFSPSRETFPLHGEVLFPSTVRKGDDFDFVVILTNPTTNPIFIKHIVLHRSSAPSLLDGATVTSVQPEMNFEILVTSRNDMQYSYFREIKPGETQTVIFHMQALNPGLYYENVGVYAKDLVLPEPAFMHAFHFIDAEIEITP